MRFKFRTLALYMKKRYPKMTVERAGVIKYRVSLFYMFISWQIFGGLLYLWYKKEDKAVKNVEYLNPSPLHYKMTKAHNVRMVRISGFDVIDDVEVDIRTPEGLQLKDNYTEYLKTRKERNLPQLEFDEFQKQYVPPSAESTMELEDAQPM